jgi:hypothetical protein
MDARGALLVYLLVAAAAGFVTASRNLPFPILVLVLLALAAVAILVRGQVLGIGPRSRVTVAFFGVYLATFFLVAVFLR